MKKSSSTIVFLLYLMVLIAFGALVVFMRSDLLNRKSEKPSPAPSVVVAPKKSVKSGKIEVLFEKASAKKGELIRFSFKNGTDKAVFVTPESAQISPAFFIVDESGSRTPEPHCPVCTVIDPPAIKVQPGASLAYIWDQKTQEGIVEPGTYRIEIEYWESESETGGKQALSEKFEIKRGAD